MTDKEIYDALKGSLGTYGGGFWGTSMADQYRNAGLGLSDLNRLVDEGRIDLDNETDLAAYNKYKSQLRSQQNNSIAGGALAGFNGLTQIATNTMNLADINDTTTYQRQLDDVSRIGALNYNSYDQVASEYGRLDNSIPHIDSEYIRGVDTKGKIGGVASSTLAGASAGMTIGGPWGALAGGIVGLGSGLLGVNAGDRKAAAEESFLQQKAKNATEIAQLNLGAAQERVAQGQQRRGVVNMAEQGGKIKRKQSIHDFAAKALRKPRMQQMEPSSRIVHTHCAGGTMVRFKK